MAPFKAYFGGWDLSGVQGRNCGFLVPVRHAFRPKMRVDARYWAFGILVGAKIPGVFPVRWRSGVAGFDHPFFIPWWRTHHGSQSLRASRVSGHAGAGDMLRREVHTAHVAWALHEHHEPWRILDH